MISRRLLGTLIFSAVLSSCQDQFFSDVTKSADSGILNEKDTDPSGLIRIKATDYTANNSSPLLADDEPDDILYNTTLRGMRANEPLQLSIQGQELHFRFFSPRKVSDLKVWATINGYEEEFLLAVFEEIPPFTEFHQVLPPVKKNAFYHTRSGKLIQIMQNPYLSEVDMSVKAECDDPFWVKVTTMPYNLQVDFGKYSLTGSWSHKILPAHCREAIAFAMNMGYMFSSEKFRAAFAEREYFRDNEGTNAIAHEELIPRFMRKDGRLNFGHVTGVNGLGGGVTYGIAQWQYLGHYADDAADPHTFFHEYGHAMGYGHSGNMTYECVPGKLGFNDLCVKVYTEMCISKELPVYSRRFMHTRRNGKLYGNEKYHTSRYVIEDPELDAIDGGLDISSNTDLIEDVCKGTPLNFSLSYEDVPGATAETFSPKDVCADDHRVYVLNDATNAWSVEVFTEEGGVLTHERTLQTWSYNGNEQTFIGQPKGIAVGNGKLYVVNVSSRVDVFDTNTLEFITAIGTGSWGDGVTQIEHGMEVIAKGDRVIVRDKKRLNIYAEEDIVAENYCNVARMAQSIYMGESMQVYGSDMDMQGFVYTSHDNSRRIYKYDPRKVQAGQNISPVATFDMKVAPLDVVCFDNRLLVSQASAPRLVELDPATGEVIQDHSAVQDFGRLEKISVARGTFFGIDRQNKRVIALPMTQFERANR